MRRLLLALACLTPFGQVSRADFVATFEDQTLAANSANNNAGNAAGFTSGGLFFNNSFQLETFGTQTYEVWSGWAISNRTETVSESTVASSANNQYASYQYDAQPGIGSAKSATYGIGFSSGYVNLAAGTQPFSMDVANTAYAYLAMVNGNQFATAFHAGSFFTLTITGFDGSGATGSFVGTPVNFDLARYATDLDRPVQGWATIPLTSLKGAHSLGFSFTSSDVGRFGINTPTYFAADNLRVVPEPSSLILIMVGMAGMIVRSLRPQVVKN